MTFNELGISDVILGTIQAAGFVTPTPIQVQAIPIALQGKDIIGIAQTGTGKTLAFGIPLLERVLATKGHALIVLPTRELAIQVDESLRRIGRSLGVRTAVIIGGASMSLQTRDLRINPQVVIGTPGRIIDHLEHRSLNLNQVTTLVLDEADRMLDLGFAPQIRRILEVVPKNRQTLLFSATMPPDIVKIAQTYMQLPLRVEIAPSGTAADKVTQELFIVGKEQKPALLGEILKQYQGTVLVFTRTKHGAKKLTRIVAGMGHTVAEIHGNRSLPQRREALGGFKNGKYRILIATDIAARGIDVTGIELVTNYDLPEQAEDYVHRIGRTGRAGQTGHAITFVEPAQRGKIRNIERLVRASLAIRALPALPNTPQIQAPIPAPSNNQQIRPSRPAFHQPQRPAPFTPNRPASQPVTQPAPRPSIPEAPLLHPTWGREYGGTKRRAGSQGPRQEQRPPRR